MVFHGGAWQGFKSSITRVLDDQLTIIFFANSWATNDVRLTRGLLAIVYPEFSLPSLAAIPDRDPKLANLTRRALLELSKGSINSELFAPRFREELTPLKTKQLSDQLNSLSLPVAVIHLSELIERRDVNGLRIYRYLLTDIGKSLSATVTFGIDDKILDLDLAEL
jgi:hypothetical protein